ncbi:hypothetical protein E2562_010116 [Oryza meyeriana var. granulata]|uniref:Uncharacterized protein n=1 Tax=Oryza meyeriana var. granulata TaxID=110450 RepID=A0A6G1EI91_9ORYZ|nr:hypothetical protein E2562_010116 [Oryza meyeriana var. granulata]
MAANSDKLEGINEEDDTQGDVTSEGCMAEKSNLEMTQDNLTTKMVPVHAGWEHDVFEVGSQ